jgi:hypothetical protein
MERGGIAAPSPFFVSVDSKELEKAVSALE